MSTYSSKSNARRAARKNTGGDDGSFEVYQVEGGWTYREIDAGTSDMEAPENPDQREVNSDESGRLRKSLVERPTAMVWFIAEEMKQENPNVRRKDVIDECIKRGIAYYTARTQYQRWLETVKAAEQMAHVEKQ